MRRSFVENLAKMSRRPSLSFCLFSSLENDRGTKFIRFESLANRKAEKS